MSKWAKRAIRLTVLAAVWAVGYYLLLPDDGFRIWGWPLLAAIIAVLPWVRMHPWPPILLLRRHTESVEAPPILPHQEGGGGPL